MISVFSSVLANWCGFRGGDHPKLPFSGRQLPILAVLVSLVLAVSALAQDVPCLSGQGPLQEWQSRCGEISFISTAEIGQLGFSTANYWDLIVDDMSDASAPLISVRLETQQDWKTVLEGGTVWTFRINGKNYELSGEDLAEAVKDIAQVKK